MNPTFLDDVHFVKALVSLRDAENFPVTPLPGSVTVESSDQAVATVKIDESYDGGADILLTAYRGQKLGAVVITLSGKNADGTEFTLAGTIAWVPGHVVTGAIRFEAPAPAVVVADNPAPAPVAGEDASAEATQQTGTDDVAADADDQTDSSTTQP